MGLIKYRDTDGSVKEILTLRGEQGPQGSQGIQGPKGDKGDQGESGCTLDGAISFAIENDNLCVYISDESEYEFSLEADGNLYVTF